jgi:hypothetical protein
MTKRIPNLDTFSAIIDRLIIEVHKVATFENRKREEQNKPNPDQKKITSWDNSSREANECRAALKAKLDELFTQAVRDGDYETLDEARTF